MRAMILAAGRGERLRPLTDHTPKALVPVAGRALIGWHLDRLRSAGITDVVINLCWLGEHIEAALGDGSGQGVRIVYSREPTALETAGGIVQALPLLGQDPFLVINGDVFCDADLSALTAKAGALPGETLAYLLLADNPPQHPLGDFALAAGLVGDLPAQRLTFTGLGLYRPALFAGIVPGSRAALGPLLRQAAARGQVRGEHFQGCWVDVGTAERLAALNRQLTPTTRPGACP